MANKLATRETALLTPLAMPLGPPSHAWAPAGPAVETVSGMDT